MQLPIRLVKFHIAISIRAFNLTALRKAKIVYNFGLSECNRVKFSTVISIREVKLITAVSLRTSMRCSHI